MIDNIQFYNRALTATESRAQYDKERLSNLIRDYTIVHTVYCGRFMSYETSVLHVSTTDIAQLIKDEYPLGMCTVFAGHIQEVA